MKKEKNPHELPTETKEWIRKQYEGKSPEAKATIRENIEVMKNRFSHFGLTHEELELAYFHSLEYMREIRETTNNNILANWMVLCVERLVLMQVIGTRSEEERQQICDNIFDKAMYRSDFIS